MTTRHNLAVYEAAGIEWAHVPVASAADGVEALDTLLALLRRELPKRGAVAVHGNRHTDFVAALCAAHLHQTLGTPLARALHDAMAAGLTVTADSAALLGVEWADYEGSEVDPAVK